MEITQFTKALDEKKRISSKSGREYWMARDIQEILGYSEWRNFQVVIEKAIKSMEVMGLDISDLIVETNKMVEIGSGAKRERADYYLTRYACYIIAMNGDVAKREISLAQSYFAVQTRKQEIQNSLMLDAQRLELRNQVTEHNKYLSGAAKEAGVVNFPKFHGAGYKGLYGGMSVKNIKAKKGIPEKDDLLDRVGRTELAMNHFRITQTEEKLAGIRNNEDKATQLHYEVGQEVRAAVERIQGIMPEGLPAEPHIKEVEKKLKQASVKSLPPKKD